ncbi:tRNA nucleotidyltransferase (CCA-adding enzyme) [Halobacillus dabanensis]|uniref:CCA-adding enzyme n=1 Tax=Halobacillus dabanensis TaxID=240302 RepID=A0A1I3VY73_HALDA|nr:CCA tRNA nucleotidyltransferase [Halobacillus dabanensis]SFJ99913.1 tRNA nucleotidyltransferase (CCA-adding enzyme) [Halobacillus dabanensis]
MKHKIFSGAFDVIDKIEEAGGEAYIVGGSVRDYLSNRTVGDIDIATSEPPQRIQEIFEKVIPVGIEHGTVIVRHRSCSYEVTTYRTEEGYEDFRRPDHVTFVRDIKLDLARRDFTMNAIAMDRHGNLVDPFHGREAIEKKKVIAVGNPVGRFREDPLRMMRAIRFASQLSFDIEGKTRDALLKESELLAHISIERIAIEMEKLYAGVDYKFGIKLLEETGLRHQLPILWGSNITKDIPGFPLSHWHEIIPYYLIQRPSLSIQAFIKSWKLSNATRRKAEHLVKALRMYDENQSVTPWLVYQLPEELYESFVNILFAIGWDDDKLTNRLYTIKRSLPIQAPQDLAFQAKDLISIFSKRKKGPWISEVMKEIEFYVVSGKVTNDYEKIKEWVIKWNPPASS